MKQNASAVAMYVSGFISALTAFYMSTLAQKGSSGCSENTIGNCLSGSLYLLPILIISGIVCFIFAVRLIVRERQKPNLKFWSALALLVVLAYAYHFAFAR